MELVGYRENIEFLNEMFPGRVTITIPECAKAMDCNVNTIYELIKPHRKNPIPTQLIGTRRRVVPIVGLARWLCMKG